METKDSIIVIDNFFNLNTLNLIKLDLSKSVFTNRFTERKNLSIYQKIYFNVILSQEHFAVQEVCKKLEKMNFKIKNINSNYFLSTKHKEATPHKDKSAYNCLIYLQGENLINSGTGFYDLINNEHVLNCHIGFKENRAIIFDSKIYHTSLQFDDRSGKRYVMANFIYE
jgi:hypothetical protein